MEVERGLGDGRETVGREQGAEYVNSGLKMVKNSILYMYEMS